MFGNLLMQSVVADLGKLAGEVVLFVSIVAGLVVAVLRGRTNHNANLEKILSIAESVKATDGWALDIEQKVNTIAEVVTNLSPDAKAALEARGTDIAKLQADLLHAREELKKLYGVVPEAEVQPDLVVPKGREEKFE